MLVLVLVLVLLVLVLVLLLLLLVLGMRGGGGRIVALMPLLMLMACTAGLVHAHLPCVPLRINVNERCARPGAASQEEFATFEECRF